LFLLPLRQDLHHPWWWIVHLIMYTLFILPNLLLTVAMGLYPNICLQRYLDLFICVLFWKYTTTNNRACLWWKEMTN
jgi:hypothetical protein